MANGEHLSILEEGVETWNQWRSEHPNMEPDLRGAELSNADLKFVNFYKTDLTGAKLKKAQLWNSDLGCAILDDADLSGAEIIWSNISEAFFYRANLQGANLEGSNLSETHFEDADLSGCRVYAISAWKVYLSENTKQRDLIITPKDEPSVFVDDLELAQFIYLLLNHENLQKVLNTVTQRGVLLLGRFGGGGIELLRSVAEKLRDFKYLPMIFDFERPRDRNYTETIKTLAGLSRFVIVDLSGPSVPQELYATIPHFKIPFVPIIEGDRKIYAMFTDLLEYQWVVKPPLHFTNENELLELLPGKVIEPAEEMCRERRKLLKELFG